jgi:hypothetical protein
MTNRPWFWNPDLIRKEESISPAHASDAPNVVGRLAKKTAGLVTAGICGTPSTLAGYALRASTSGLRPSVSHVSSGRHTRIGMRNELLMLALDGNGGPSPPSEACLRIHLGNRDHTAAKGETKDYARAFHRVFDSQPRGRSDSAVGCPALRRYAQGARSRQ